MIWRLNRCINYVVLIRFGMTNQIIISKTEKRREMEFAKTSISRRLNVRNYIEKPQSPKPKNLVNCDPKKKKSSKDITVFPALSMPRMRT